MTFKEFCRWCNDRAADGCWGPLEALACIDLMENIRKNKFWERRKKWEEIEKQVLDEIVNPTNALIEKYKKGEPIDASC